MDHRRRGNHPEKIGRVKSRRKLLFSGCEGRALFITISQDEADRSLNRRDEFVMVRSSPPGIPSHCFRLLFCPGEGPEIYPHHPFGPRPPDPESGHPLIFAPRSLSRSRPTCLMNGLAQVVFKYSRIRRAAVAPSPDAEATCLVLPARTSPAAKIPGMVVSKSAGSRP